MTKNVSRRDDGSVTDPEVEAYLAAVVQRSREALGAEFVGAYVAGSLALNAFQPGRSDIDIVLLCRAPLAEATKRELIARLRHSALPCPARGLELVVYTLATAQSATAEPAFELELNDGPSMAFRQSLHPDDRPDEDGTFWYGLDRSILHQSGRALAGPPAAEAFTEIPVDAVRALLIESLNWWLAQTDEQAISTDDAVLGACRSLIRHRYGTWLSKVAAGQRLLADNHPSAEVIEQSIAARTGAPPPSRQQAKAFQEGVLQAFRRTP